MSEPEVGPPVPSLIQQRMALSRRRGHAIYMLVSSAVIAIGWGIVLVIDGNRALGWICAIVFGASAIYGVIQRRRVLRDIRVFTEQYGAGAGVQTPVR